MLFGTKAGTKRVSMLWMTFHDRLRPKRRDEITESPKRIKVIMMSLEAWSKVAW